MPTQSDCVLRLLALLLLRYDGPWAGPLGDMNDELRAMINYYGGIKRYHHFFTALDCAALEDPIPSVFEGFDDSHTPNADGVRPGAGVCGASSACALCRPRPHHGQMAGLGR